MGLFFGPALPSSLPSPPPSSRWVLFYFVLINLFISSSWWFWLCFRNLKIFEFFCYYYFDRTDSSLDFLYLFIRINGFELEVKESFFGIRIVFEFELPSWKLQLYLVDTFYFFVLKSLRKLLDHIKDIYKSCKLESIIVYC